MDINIVNCLDTKTIKSIYRCVYDLSDSKYSDFLSKLESVLDERGYAPAYNKNGGFIGFIALAGKRLKITEYNL